jgi:RND family efflux transporter MFP subunit
VAVSTGNEVNTGEPLLSIAQMQQIETTFFVPSNIISSIELKAPVYMVIEGDTLMGRVSKKAMTMSSQNMAYRVKAKFKNQQNKIISGSTRQIFVHTQTLSNRIIIPWECIKQQGETNYVFINQDGKAQLKVIEIERIVGINAIIKTGLQPGDKLIINGIAKLKNAMPIEA